MVRFDRGNSTLDSKYAEIKKNKIVNHDEQFSILKDAIKILINICYFDDLEKYESLTSEQLIKINEKIFNQIRVNSLDKFENNETCKISSMLISKGPRETANLAISFMNVDNYASRSTQKKISEVEQGFGSHNFVSLFSYILKPLPIERLKEVLATNFQT